MVRVLPKEWRPIASTRREVPCKGNTTILKGSRVFVNESKTLIALVKHGWVAGPYGDDVIYPVMAERPANATAFMIKYRMIPCHRPYPHTRIGWVS
jgi:hypothetical protein